MIPPSRDGVGDAAFKLHTLMQGKNISSFLLTSADQENGGEIIALVREWNLGSFQGIKNALVKRDITHVVFHYPSPKFFRNISLSFLPLFLRMNGFATVTYVHEFAVYSILGRLRVMILMLWSKTIITADSPSYHLAKKIPLIRRKVRLLPHGSNIVAVPPEYFSEGRVRRVEEPVGKLQLLFFGFIRSGKGLEAILDAFGKNSGIRESFQLSIVGGLSAAKNHADEELLNRIENIGGVRYLGYLDQNELPKVFATTDVVILPFEEGVTERRGSFMTAMMFGKTLITTKPIIPIEGLEHFHNIIFIDNSTLPEIETILQKVSEFHKKTLYEIGNAARLWYEDRYSDGCVIKRFLEVNGISDVNSMSCKNSGRE